MREELREMTTMEGKALLQNGLEQCQRKMDIDAIILYLYGTAKKAEEYHNDEIKSDVKPNRMKSGIKYVVKCFIHMGIYVAWPIEIGRGSGKFIAYKKDLLAMETDIECNYKRILIEKNGEAYYFRGEDGIKKFIQKNVLMT